MIVLGAYLLGSIPTGFLVAQAKGIDIRRLGSGNIGATNVFRILGVPAGILVLVIDGLKGYAASAWLVDLAGGWGGGLGPHEELLRIIAGVCAVLGHNYTCWLWFKGGKGIATSAGVLAALVPGALGIVLTLWIILFVTTRFVSVASIFASAALPFATWITGQTHLKILFTALLAVLAIYKHKSNIQRLLNGTEHRIRFRKREVTS